MTGEALQENGWILREALADDIDDLMHWFPEYDDVRVWGGPSFRFPFTRETFVKDIYWGKMASFCLCEPSSRVVAFGQFLPKKVRELPAEGYLINAHASLLPRHRGAAPIAHAILCGENKPAYECYRALGFAVTEYPDDVPHADVCYYLTRPPQ